MSGEISQTTELNLRIQAESNSEDVKALSQLAIYLLNNQKVDEAISKMKQAIARNPKDSEWRWFLAHVLCEQRGLDRATDEYDEIVAWSGIDQVADRRLITHLISRQRVDLANRYITKMYQNHIKFEYDDELNLSPGQLVIKYFHADTIIVFHKGFSFRNMLIERLLTMLEYICRACVDRNNISSYIISLDDAPEGDCKQLCFSGFCSNHILIPDPHFVESNAYKNSKITAQLHLSHWQERSDEVYWRGSLTGYASTIGDIIKNPRVQLCLLADYSKKYDCKIIHGGLGQYLNHEPMLSDVLNSLSVLGDAEDNNRNLYYKYLIDIDGNTNSWAGLMTKLISGGLVIKLKSKYKQWFYDQLINMENIIYISNIKSDLQNIVSWAKNNDDKCRKIGIEGKKFADRLSYDSGYNSFLESLCLYES